VGDTGAASDTSAGNDSAAAADTASAQDTTAQVDGPGDTAAEVAGQDAAKADATPGPSVTKTSSSGKHEVTLQGPTTIAVGKTLKYTVLIAKSDGSPALGLSPDISFIHTQMGHGGLKEPAMAEMGEGLYEVDDVQASMAGKWALKFVLPANDKVGFEITVK